MLSCLISRQSRISCRFHVTKIRILFFHGLMISEKNINKSNIKWFTRSCSWICSSSRFTKTYCVVIEICCVLLAFTFPDLVWCWWCVKKQIFHALFLFNINYLRWIILILNKKAWNISLIPSLIFSRGTH